LVQITIVRTIFAKQWEQLQIARKIGSTEFDGAWAGFDDADFATSHLTYPGSEFLCTANGRREQ